MDKLQYRNVAGTMKHIEGWLEKALSSCLPADSPERKPLKHLSIDRESLEAHGLDKEAQDKLYRSLYLYCNGVHEFIREVSQSSGELTAKLRLTFQRLFEQQFDAKQSEKFAELMAKQQDQSSLTLVEAQRAQISSLQSENQMLADDLTVSRADIDTARFHRDMILLTTKEVEGNLRNSIEHYRGKLALAEDKAAQLVQSHEQYQECLSMSREVILKLAKELHDMERKADDFSSRMVGLQKEYNELSKKYKSCEAACQRASEDLSKYREKAMTLEHTNDELSDQVSRFALERRQLKQQLEALATQRSEQHTIQAELVQLADLHVSALSQAAECLAHVHINGDSLRAHCVGISSAEYLDDYCPSQAAAVLDGLRVSVASLEEATVNLRGSAKATTAADTVQSIRMQQACAREIRLCLQSIGDVIFANTSLRSVKSFLSLLHHQSSHYNVLSAQLRTQQISLSAAEMLSSVYLAVVGRQQSQSSALSRTIQDLEGQVRQSQAESAALAVRLGEQAVRLQSSQTALSKLSDLERRHRAVLDQFHAMETSKREVEEALSVARSEVRDLQGSHSQLQAAGYALREKDALLRDLRNHIVDLEEKLQMATSQVKNQVDASAEHRNVFEGVLDGLMLLHRLVEHGEDCAAQGVQVFETSGAPLMMKTAVCLLRQREVKASIDRMRSDVALRVEAFLQDEGLDRAERDCVAEIVQLLREIASGIVFQLRRVDELRAARKEVASWQREYETLKAFSAKERARLTRLMAQDAAPMPS